MKILLIGEIRMRRSESPAPESPEELAPVLLHRVLRRAKRWYRPEAAVVLAMRTGEETGRRELLAEFDRVGLPVVAADAPAALLPARLGDLPVAAETDGVLRIGDCRFAAGRPDDARTCGVGALTASPFPFRIVELTEAGRIAATADYRLKLPDGFRVVDCHNHTPYAYCCENMTVPRAVALGRWFGLDGMVFTEHSSHLYFSRSECYAREAYRLGIDGATQDLTEDYLAMCRAGGDGFAVAGMELDIDWRGRRIVRPETGARLALRLAAVHNLPDTGSAEERREAFLRLTEAHLAAGADILAHPFRVMRDDPPEWVASLHRPVAELLAKYGTAAEMNFHHGMPPDEFVRLCLDRGVKLAFGGDSHELGMVGDFQQQLDQLARLGAASRLAEILYRPAAFR